ncbi:MAG: hypothetical protein RIQ53_399 [Pseudomonadota bacterium]
MSLLLRPATAHTRAPLRLAVLGLSARQLAERAREEGCEVVLAADLFGDADTRRASRRWCDLRLQADETVQPGLEAGLQLSEPGFAAALRQARAAGAAGWLAGAGFEAQPRLLALGARLLPLFGTPPLAQQAVRRPQAFFGLLARHGLPHPDWLPLPATDEEIAALGSGWLLKQAHASGGAHVRRWQLGEPAPAAGWAEGSYLQCHMPGQPMSATFVADGHVAELLGYNRQIVAGRGARPWRFAGVIGPLPVPAAVRSVIEQALAVLVPAFGLRGLCSLDFLWDGHGLPQLLEVNARPPASLALYPQAAPLSAHLAACWPPVDDAGTPAWPASPVAAIARAVATLAPAEMSAGERAGAAVLRGDGLPASDTLPQAEAGAWIGLCGGGAPGHGPAPVRGLRPPAGPATLRGLRLVCALQGLTCTPALANALAAQPGCHDLPQPGAWLPAGQPVCSISAIGVDEGSLQDQLQQRALGVQRLLERHARAGDAAAAPASSSPSPSPLPSPVASDPSASPSPSAIPSTVAPTTG